MQLFSAKSRFKSSKSAKHTIDIIALLEIAIIKEVNIVFDKRVSK